MSIIPITADNLQLFKTTARPKRKFVSSSQGITGSFFLHADNSKCLKDLEFRTQTGPFSDDNIEITRQALITQVQHSRDGHNQGDASSHASRYMEHVSALQRSIRQTKRQEVRRFIAGTKLEDNFGQKFTIQNALFEHYRLHYKSADWSYTNYHSLNFFTSPTVPGSSTIIYPAGTGSVGQQNVNFLAPSGSFTFDFYLKSHPSSDTRAGTILHMSSCYAISLVTGSSIAPDGKPSDYRLLLQLSQSADIAPSSIKVNGNTLTSPVGTPTTYSFISSEGSIRRNTWHHVSIRWGGQKNMNGFGDITIDGKKDRTFNIDKKTIMQATSSGNVILDPDALFLGNYYEGTNTGNNAIAKFFAPDISQEEGLTNFNPALTNGDPANYKFSHPLKAELHDIKIFDRYCQDNKVTHHIKSGSDLDSGMLFYLPPFFVKESRSRQTLQTPFRKVTGNTENPFNVPMSFGVAGLDINLENFTRDFVRSEYPRLLHLSSSHIKTQVDTEKLTATDILYHSGSSRKRNLTILPCDNGKFEPNFNLLASGSRALQDSNTHPESKFKNDLGKRDLTVISLRNMLKNSHRLPGLTGEALTGSLAHAIAASTPENPGNEGDEQDIRGYYLNSSKVLTVYQRTGDESSNEVVFFDVSNLFYGDRIYPGTLKLTDHNLTGSGGAVSITLKDNSEGNIYRADSVEPHSTWSSVGTILYDDGIIVIKSPHLPHFGKDGFTIEFEGERNIHTVEYLIPLPAAYVNSSSNPNFKKMPPTDYVNEDADEFVYLTGVQLHDENLNVVMRANFAQPFVKRDGDRFLVKIRVDY